MEQISEEAIKSRMKEVLSFHKTTQNKFADADRPLQRRLSRQLNGGTALSITSLLPFIERFPDVSLEWLFRGEGEMIKK